MEKKGFGAQLKGAMTQCPCSLVGYTFVDDTDLVHTADDPNSSAQEIMDTMQNAVDHWNGLLSATGGAIEPSKSFIYIIDFCWTSQKWRYKTRDEAPGDITICIPHTGQEEKLTRLELAEARRTLGIMMSMDGGQTQQEEFLFTKAAEFADYVRTSTLDKNNTRHALNTVSMHIIEYLMAAISLSEKQWAHITSPIMTQVLPKTGMTCSFPHVVLYTPLKYQGRGLMKPYLNNYIQQIYTLISQVNEGTLMGELIQVELENLCLEVGLPGILTDAPYQLFGLAMTDRWLKSLWQFMVQHNITLHDPLPKLQPQWQNNCCIMSMAISKFPYPDQIQKVNECQQFLKATYLSGLTTCDDTRLIIQAYQLLTSFEPHTSSCYTWPRPPPYMTPQHCQICQTLFSHLIEDNTSLKLRQPLGAWQQDQMGVWKWRYHMETGGVFQKTQEGWLVWTAGGSTRTRRRSSRFFPTAQNLHNIPRTAKMVTGRKGPGIA
jgi:hypothetical protein